MTLRTTTRGEDYWRMILRKSVVARVFDVMVQVKEVVFSKAICHSQNTSSITDLVHSIQGLLKD